MKSNNPPPILGVIHGCKGCNFSATRTEKTLNKKNSSTNGSISLSREDLNSLNSAISIARETLAILLSGQASRLIRASGKTTREEAHLQILLQDLMEEIWKMDAVITTLMSTSTEPSGKL